MSFLMHPYITLKFAESFFPQQSPPRAGESLSSSIITKVAWYSAVSESLLPQSLMRRLARENFLQESLYKLKTTKNNTQKHWFKYGSQISCSRLNDFECMVILWIDNVWTKYK